LSFFNDTATTETYTLSLHDALPICLLVMSASLSINTQPPSSSSPIATAAKTSEEHTSELQSHLNLVCRLLLEHIILQAMSCIILISLKNNIEYLNNQHQEEFFFRLLFFLLVFFFKRPDPPRTHLLPPPRPRKK